ncbi:uncharacterized protein Dwil_GK21895 [Drosophila willistoni]|nr:uncharacterized protein Dwil_GK21895 [Drosophila willistoni]
MWLRLLLLGLMLVGVQALICTRRPANTVTHKSPVDENFVISITDNPETYILGQEYNVSLNAFNGHRYISYILALENENGDFNYNDDLGHFELNDRIETRFSPNCINMVENTNTNPKTHMHLTWVAPSRAGSGCILIRATVLQHREVWHMDDGGLTRRICEEVTDDVESQPTPVSPAIDVPCCACDEARYELIFEGVWSRNLHPKDFPARAWETRFCELVGAAHSSDYRFWEPGSLASEGLKQYAQYCNSRLLEREFSMNFRDQKIRTIIKARGPAYPNLNGKTMASIRVDPVHHMVSFASKIEPSPDWIVGISGVELCLRNCTWLEEKVIKLYPWDVGTDAGPSYRSSDQPQVPPDVIRRMRSDFPNDPRSPFYDKDGSPMKPMAVLTVRRQRLYERRCADEDSNNDAEVPRECLTHPWSSFSDCSSKCGPGMQYRRRVYKQPELAKVYNCNVPQYEERECQGEICGQNHIMPFEEETGFDDLAMGGPGRQQQQQQQHQQHSRAECQLGPWSGWSSCSVTCGEGYQIRQRQYINPGVELKCQSVYPLELKEMRKCAGQACLGNLRGTQYGSGAFDDQYGAAGGGGTYDSQPEAEQEQQTYDGNNLFEDKQSGYGGNLEVGDLKGSDYNWDQNSNTNTQWSQPGRQQQSPPRLEDMQRSSWQQGPVPNTPFEPKQNVWNNNGNSFNIGLEESLGTLDPDIPASSHCFQMLNTVQPRCPDQTITGHYWFYNFCADECMIYAADLCDRNMNKFTRFEECEKCRVPQNAALLQQHKNSMQCQVILTALRAGETSRDEQRNVYNYNQPFNSRNYGK